MYTLCQALLEAFVACVNSFNSHNNPQTQSLVFRLWPHTASKRHRDSSPQPACTASEVCSTVSCCVHLREVAADTLFHDNYIDLTYINLY